MVRWILKGIHRCNHFMGWISVLSFINGMILGKLKSIWKDQFHIQCLVNMCKENNSCSIWSTLSLQWIYQFHHCKMVPKILYITVTCETPNGKKGNRSNMESWWQHLLPTSIDWYQSKQITFCQMCKVFLAVILTKKDVLLIWA